MKLLLSSLTIAFLTGFTALAQPLIIPPFDHAHKDPTFVAFRETLLKVVASKDIDALVGMSDPQIQLSFGGDAGHEAMRLFFKNSETYTAGDLWNELQTLLNLGGGFRDESFTAPYTFVAETPPNFDPFQTFFVTGSDVLLRKQPNKSSTPINVVSHAVVQVLEWDSDMPYQRITMPNTPELTGLYIATEYLRSVVDYRAGFSKLEGAWKMMFFIAGD